MSLCVGSTRRVLAKQTEVLGASPRVLRAFSLRGERLGWPEVCERSLRVRCAFSLRTRGELTQTSGHTSRLPRREKARSTRGEAPKTAGCVARTQRVLPTHSDICLQRPALPAAGLN